MYGYDYVDGGAVDRGGWGGSEGRRGGYGCRVEEVEVEGLLKGLNLCRL